jgi:hypothetical protein
MTQASEKVVGGSCGQDGGCRMRLGSSLNGKDVRRHHNFVAQAKFCRSDQRKRRMSEELLELWCTL